MNTQRHSKRCYPANGFTLIEMLVVIAIIILLMALLMPALNNGEARLAQIKCLSNLRQHHVAVMLYVAENNNFFPKFPRTQFSSSYCPRAWWTLDPWPTANVMVGTMWNYCSAGPTDRLKMLQCPADKWEPAIIGCAGSYTRNFSYSYNFLLNHATSDTSDTSCQAPTMRLLNIAKPSHRVMLLDERRPNDGYYVFTTTPSATHCDDEGTTRHFGKGNYMCFDGHSVLLPPFDVWVGSNTVVNLYLWN